MALLALPDQRLNDRLRHTAKGRPDRLQDRLRRDASACWQASEAIGVFFGYRLISFDYEDGSGRDYQRYDLTEQGPLVGMSVSF